MAAFLEQAEAKVGANLPPLVEGEFEVFLACGSFAQGLLRLRCGDCGHDKLVANSCKRRGFYPLCGARLVAQTAAHRVGHVMPQALKPSRTGAPVGVSFGSCDRQSRCAGLDILVANKPGACGAIGLACVAASTAGGFTHVPHPRSAPAILGLLAGDADATAVAYAELRQLVASGKLHPLVVMAVMANNRVAGLDHPPPRLKE